MILSHAYASLHSVLTGYIYRIHSVQRSYTNTVTQMTRNIAAKRAKRLFCSTMSSTTTQLAATIIDILLCCTSQTLPAHDAYHNNTGSSVTGLALTSTSLNAHSKVDENRLSITHQGDWCSLVWWTIKGYVHLVSHDCCETRWLLSCLLESCFCSFNLLLSSLCLLSSLSAFLALLAAGWVCCLCSF